MSEDELPHQQVAIWLPMREPENDFVNARKQDEGESDHAVLL